MSIQSLIEDCLTREELFRLHPWVPSIKPVRLVYISPTVHEYIHDSENERAGRLHGDLDSFIGGDRITVSMIPRKAREAYMGLLGPTSDGVWDIRSRAPRPALRLLGGFASRDHFVGLVLRERAPLGKYGSPEWKLAVNECKHQWRKRFHPYVPINGDNPSDYLSNYACLD